MSVEIPNYRIIEKLGEGAQTRVYRARCMRTGSDYTVKIVKIVKPEDANLVELMKAEHLIGTSIDHPVTPARCPSIHQPSRMLRLGTPLRAAFMPLVPDASWGFCGVFSHTSTPAQRCWANVRSYSGR